MSGKVYGFKETCEKCGIDYWVDCDTQMPVHGHTCGGSQTSPILQKTGEVVNLLIGLPIIGFFGIWCFAAVLLALGILLIPIWFIVFIIGKLI